MLRKLYSNSGLILLAVLCAGVWFRNLRSFYPPKSFDFAYSDELLAPSLTPALSFEELEQEWLKLTSEDVLRRVRANATAFLRSRAIAVDIRGLAAGAVPPVGRGIAAPCRSRQHRNCSVMNPAYLGSIYSQPAYSASSVRTIRLGSVIGPAGIESLSPGQHISPFGRPVRRLQSGFELSGCYGRKPVRLRAAESERGGYFVERLPVAAHFENASLTRQERCQSGFQLFVFKVHCVADNKPRAAKRPGSFSCPA